MLSAIRGRRVEESGEVALIGGSIQSRGGFDYKRPRLLTGLVDYWLFDRLWPRSRRRRAVARLSGRGDGAREFSRAARIQLHVGDPAHQILAEKDLRIHLPGRSDDLACLCGVAEHDLDCKAANELEQTPQMSDGQAFRAIT